MKITVRQGAFSTQVSLDDNPFGTNSVINHTGNNDYIFSISMPSGIEITQNDGEQVKLLFHGIGEYGELLDCLSRILYEKGYKNNLQANDTKDTCEIKFEGGLKK